MDCIDLFKKAAVALQTDARYLELDAARRQNDMDEELQNLIGEFNLARLDLNNETSKKEPDSARTAELNQRVNDLYTQIMSSEGMVRYNAAGLNMWTTVGASGAIYGLLLAFGMLFPEQRLFIFPLPVPIKAKWMVCIWIVVELLSALGTQGSQVAHFAHLGGMLCGYIMIRYWRNHPGGGGYGRSRGQQFFDRMKDNWERRSHRKYDETRRGDGPRRESDWDYNARRKAEQDEIDRILDKVRRSGYDSLTEEEKRKLFDGGK